MTRDEAVDQVVANWIEKAERALEAARDELAAGRADFAVNRIYYGCFYALSAVLLKDGQHFVRHVGVRTAMHKFLVQGGELNPALAKFYDDMFEARHQADYSALTCFDSKTVMANIVEAGRFVTEMIALIAKRVG